MRYGNRARVRDYTCDCRPTFYELCHSGGECFIRRTRRLNGQVLVDECMRGRTARTLEAWTRLLAGEAG
ncbi:hypothetical protein FXF51_28565 [Nonomuraea sp. PA05]|uniref:hypothetical protein n=1 Tax=Nonomuraea sp. PA05 TaxID=2604466 RepID=UPI0011DAE369|nr:hypothetical protein [Nonomuraea sp. PA05]TYB61409.1 hypothetical protein FXF51_28565 [Nonomuraea sp. PA05]